MTHLLTGEPHDAVSHASWGRRFIAIVIDVLLFVLVPVMFGLVGFVIAGNAAEDDLYGALDMFVGSILLGFVVAMVGATVYFTLFIGRNGQTLGKRVAGIAVRDAGDTTQPIGYWRVLARVLAFGLLWVLYWVPGIIDALWPLWDERRQSLHDKIVRSVVVEL
jgi:uncharacterized RDD family membrane protein YckC